jgi:hypothetical protein
MYFYRKARFNHTCYMISRDRVSPQMPQCRWTILIPNTLATRDSRQTLLATHVVAGNQDVTEGDLPVRIARMLV